MPDADKATRELDQYLSRLYHDFPFFVKELLSHVKGGLYANLSDVDIDILSWAACSPKRGKGPRTRGVLAPRGWGKTTQISCGLAAWYLFRDPNTKILIVSKSADRAKEILKMIRDWIEMIPFLDHLKPEQGDRVRDNKFEFDVGGCEPDKTPSIRVNGIGGMLTGGRAHIVIVDDVETPENTKTIDARDDLEKSTTEFRAISSFGEREILYVGTYHHEDSLYLRLAKKGVEFKSWPAICPEEDMKVMGLGDTIQQKIRSGELKAGDIVFPHRYTPEDIAEHRKEGVTYFASQFQLISDLADSLRYPLQIKDLIVPDFSIGRDEAPVEIKWGLSTTGGMSTRRDDIPCLGFHGDGLHKQIMYAQRAGQYSSTVMYIDPAGRGADETGYAIVSFLAGTLWCKECGGFKGGSEKADMLQWLYKAREHGARRIIVEDHFSLGAVSNMLRGYVAEVKVDEGDEVYPGGWSASVEPAAHSGQQKEKRILGVLEKAMGNHRLVVDAGSLMPAPGRPREYELQYQIAALTREKGCLKHDDRVEALAGACAPFVDLLVVDPEAAEGQLTRRVREQAIKNRAKKLGLVSRGNGARWNKVGRRR